MLLDQFFVLRQTNNNLDQPLVVEFPSHELDKEKTAIGREQFRVLGSWQRVSVTIKLITITTTVAAATAATSATLTTTATTAPATASTRTQTCENFVRIASYIRFVFKKRETSF